MTKATIGPDDVDLVTSLSFDGIKGKRAVWMDRLVHGPEFLNSGLNRQAEARYPRTEDGPGRRHVVGIRRIHHRNPALKEVAGDDIDGKAVDDQERNQPHGHLVKKLLARATGGRDVIRDAVLNFLLLRGGLA